MRFIVIFVCLPIYPLYSGPFGNLPGAFFRQLKKRNPDSITTTNPIESQPNTSPINPSNTSTSSTTTTTPATAKLSAHQAKHLSSLTHISSDSTPDISSHKNVLSPSGAEIIQLFPEFSLEPPSDLNLKSLWDRICDEEVSSRMLKLNKRFISQELKKNKLKHNAGAVQALEPLLRRQVCLCFWFCFFCLYPFFVRFAAWAGK